MSMIGNYISMSEKTLQQLLAQPEAIYDFIYPPEEYPPKKRG